jgi:Fe2+ or Zn2+ uptake regulation protein
LLKGKGLIKELKFGKNTSHYDGNAEPHNHIFCLECGKLDDIQCKVHPNLTKSVEKNSGYKITSHQLEFNGICPECLERGL